MTDMKFTIAEWRRLKNLSRQDLADILEVHSNTIKNWEEKPSTIKLGDADRLAKALGVGLDNIIFLP